MQIVKFLQNGVALPPDKYADINADMRAEYLEPDEGYEITSVVINEDDLIVTEHIIK